MKQDVRRARALVCFNCTLQATTPVPTISKPFDVLAEGPILNNGRGDWRKFEPSARPIAPFLAVLTWQRDYWRAIVIAERNAGVP